MRLTRPLAALAATALVPGLLVGSGSSASADHQPGEAYDVIPLTFAIDLGPLPEDDCTIDGDLYVPEGASASDRRPAVLSTNGFGGSKADQAGLSKLFASQGYVALSYSGLGFGKSGCEITLDDREHDGEAASQLIDFLGGATGIATKDGQPFSTDAVARDGDPAEQDPRVGMVGGSYGGQVQFAAAAVTDKLDTIVPLITWNDLTYALGPNNTDQVALPGQEFPGVSTGTPGSVKTNWALGFSAIGLTGDVQNQQPDPIRGVCPNFAEFVCPALITGATTGALDPAAVKALRNASVASYQDDVKIPTLLLQGQADTLFNLNEAIATYRALEAQGTPVKMAWTEYGHSGGPAPGEIDFEDPNPDTEYLSGRILDWFDHYLKDQPGGTGPEFAYFRDWVDYDPDDQGGAEDAYKTEDSYPVAPPSTYHFSSTATSSLTGGALVTDRDDVKAGNATFEVPAGPASNGESLDVIDRFFEQPEALEPVKDAPGTFARYDTDPLTRAVEVVGSPQARLQVQAPTVEATQGEDAGKLVLYLKVADVAPDGTAEVVRNLAAPVRVPDVAEPFTVTMPAFAHRFEAGHTIRLLVAGASPNYRGNTAPAPVTIATTEDGDGSTPLPLQSLTLPTTTGGVPTSDGADPTTPGPEPTDPGDGTDPTDPYDGTDPPGGGTDGSTDGDGTTGGDAAADGTTGGQAQAAPVTTTTTTTATGAGTLPDTGGPDQRLLLAGVLLLLLGAANVAYGRRSPA